jgi:hypothetical protein
MFGNLGGALGTTSGGQKLALDWNSAGMLTVMSSWNPVRFTSGWTGFPDANTNQAEISNDTGTYKTLMIVGNKSAGLGRRVSVWDRLEVNGSLMTSGNVGIGTTNPDANFKLDVAGNVKLPSGGIAYSPGRLHINGEEILFLLNKGGTVVSRAWGGNGNLTVEGELFLGGGGRTSIRDFDGGSVGSGYHWIRTNANEGDLWMAFAYPFPGTTIPKRIEGAVPFYGRFLNSSDARNKTNVEQLGGVLAKLEHIRGVAFDWDVAQPGLGGVPGQRSMGVIAQEVESIFPELVSSYGPQGYKAVDYTGLTGILLEAVKELKAATEVLGARIEGLERAVQS